MEEEDSPQDGPQDGTALVGEKRKPGRPRKAEQQVNPTP